MLNRNLVIRNFDVLVCTVGLVRPPVSCLGIWSSTVNNDTISRFQICSPRCRIYCAEPDIITAHWNWVGNWSANSSSKHIPNWSLKNICVFRANTVGLKVANTDRGISPWAQRGHRAPPPPPRILHEWYHFVQWTPLINNRDVNAL